ncbi:MAG: RNA polymerase sigma factor [Bacteroidales bacterium]|nr:RNA polymerase sigma factor [Bacteroidales bacterium]
MPQSSQSSDNDILTLFADPKTKEQAFKLLMQRYQQEIYYNIRRVVFSHEDAADVTQNVFIKIWRHLDSFRGDSSLKTWIQRICTNESLTFLRKRKEQFSLDDDEHYTDNLLKTTSEDKFISSEHIQGLVQKAIALLPDKQRIVFSYRYFDEMPYEEMSKILDTSVGALKASYHFAYQKVVDFIKNNS